jgi:fused signal recognition particle receptor
VSEARPGVFSRLRAGLARTQARLADGIAALGGWRAVDERTLEELEALLLAADAGVPATTDLIEAVRAAPRRGVAPIEALAQTMTALLARVETPEPALATPTHVVLVVGVNGAGKTTTIAKLAARPAGRSVALAAADTFRAAAGEQLAAWAQRLRVPITVQRPGADPAAVAFDALQAARARGTQVLVVDTSGRLHTQRGLMDELGKIRRVLGRLDPTAPHETLLVLDAGNGQNALAQARAFHGAVPLSGLVLTKLDGTAKGGTVLALARELALPVRYLGIGEHAEDLRPFAAAEFTAALLGLEGAT